MNKRTPPVNSKAVIYARVSSKEQEREGFSIPAQLDLLYDYARSKGFEVVQEFKDIETAKAAGRGEFNRMVEYITEHAIQSILVEKTDRLYRNFRDYVTLEEIELEVHLVKEGEMISRNSRSHVKFIHGIKVLMAKNYLDNLSEEVKKGMSQKAKEGIFPGRAPVGYVNVEIDGKHVVVADPEVAENVRWLFQQYASGRYSLRDLCRKAHSEGLYFGGRYSKLMGMHVQKILMNPFYYGCFRWRNEIYPGVHEPIISKDLFDRIQVVLRGKSQHSGHPRRHKWAFQGMIRCGYCGCMYTAEMKKGKYIYYHCTGNHGQCPAKWVREEKIAEQFRKKLEALRFDDDVLEWIVGALKSSHVDQKKYHEDTIASLEKHYKRLQNRIDRMYVDKLDGKISDDFYDKKCQLWRKEQDEIQENIRRHRSANRVYLDEGIKIIELAQRAVFLYDKQEMPEKRRLLDFVCSNSTYVDGQLIVEYRKPFDLLADMNAKYQRINNVSMQKKQSVSQSGADETRTRDILRDRQAL